MRPILDSMAAADLIVYATPVYIWAAPAPVKAVIDHGVLNTVDFGISLNQSVHRAKSALCFDFAKSLSLSF